MAFQKDEAIHIELSEKESGMNMGVHTEAGLANDFGTCSQEGVSGRAGSGRGCSQSDSRK